MFLIVKICLNILLSSFSLYLCILSGVSVLFTLSVVSSTDRLRCTIFRTLSFVLLFFLPSLILIEHFTQFKFLYSQHVDCTCLKNDLMVVPEFTKYI